MLLGTVEKIDFNSDDARRTGEVRAWLEGKGTSIGAYDLMIAGQALKRGLTVVTHNMGEFARVPGLKVEDWTVL